MKNMFLQLRQLFAAHFWIAILFCTAILFIVDVLSGIFLFKNFNIRSSTVESVITGIVVGLVIHKICVLKER